MLGSFDVLMSHDCALQVYFTMVTHISLLSCKDNRENLTMLLVAVTGTIC